MPNEPKKWDGKNCPNCRLQPVMFDDSDTCSHCGHPLQPRCQFITQAGEKLYTVNGADELVFKDGTKQRINPDVEVQGAKSEPIIGYDPGSPDGDYETTLYGLENDDGSITITGIDQTPPTTDSTECHDLTGPMVLHGAARPSTGDWGLYEDAEKLMRIAEQTTGPKGWGATPAFVEALSVTISHQVEAELQTLLDDATECNYTGSEFERALRFRLARLRKEGER